MLDIQEPLPWGKSSATVAVLEQLVADRLLPRITDSGGAGVDFPASGRDRAEAPRKATS